MPERKVKIDSRNTLQKVVEEEIARKTKYRPNEVIFSWESPDRFTYSFSNGQKTSYALVVVLISLYFVWVGQPIITLVTLAVFFLLYVLYTVPAGRVKHTVESSGIRTGGTLYPWENLTGFFFADRDTKLVLYVNSRLNFPARLIMIVDSFAEAQKIVDACLDFIPYVPLFSEQGFFEKMFDGQYIDATTFVGEPSIEQIIAADNSKNAPHDTQVQVPRDNKTRA